MRHTHTSSNTNTLDVFAVGTGYQQREFVTMITAIYLQLSCLLRPLLPLSSFLLVSLLRSLFRFRLVSRSVFFKRVTPTLPGRRSGYRNLSLFFFSPEISSSSKERERSVDDTLLPVCVGMCGEKRTYQRRTEMERGKRRREATL